MGFRRGGGFVSKTTGEETLPVVLALSTSAKGLLVLFSITYGRDKRCNSSKVWA
jgi:hypothetical protein